MHLLHTYRDSAPLADLGSDRARARAFAAEVARPIAQRNAAPAPDLPPVVVMNLYHSGLGIVRQLHGSGVRVVGLSANPRIYGNFSNMCEVRSAPDSQDQPQQLLESLIAAAANGLEGAVVFPTRDADVLFLDRYRSELSLLYRLALPPRDALLRVMDKSALAEAAAGAGIPVPETIVVHDETQLSPAAEAVGFPCVIKPIRAIDWKGSNWKLAGEAKAFCANSRPELTQFYQRVSKVRREVLLQQWIPGTTEDIVVWGGYVNQQGDPLAYFTARKLLQGPRDFGTGCIVESCLIPELLKPSLLLCKALGHHGIVEIEYKKDAEDGKFKLIEVNPRHWDWHGLSVGCGVDLTWSAYCDLCGKAIQPTAPNDCRVKWIADDALPINILSAMSHGYLDLRTVPTLLAGRRMYSVFSWHDPFPFVRYAATNIIPRLIKACINKGRQRFTSQSTDIAHRGDSVPAQSYSQDRLGHGTIK